jgi:ATP-dependent RNA helicase DDX31/DBP7
MRQARRPRKRGDGDSDDDNDGGQNAERRMNVAVRSQGRLVKKGGAMVSSGVSEFQVASGDALEGLINRT